MTANSLLILNGPGLAGLGAGEDAFSGHIRSMTEIESACTRRCEELGLSPGFRQTDDDTEMLQWLDADAQSFDALIINPGRISPDSGDKRTGYAEAIARIAGSGKPVIEVHLENIFLQGSEPIKATGTNLGLVCGMGVRSYLLAIRAVAQRLAE